MTLGPSGRNVVLRKALAALLLLKMVYLLLKKLNLKINSKTWALKWLKKLLLKTSDVAGDGTTTATVLAQAILVEGMKAVAAGMNPMDFKRGIDKAVAAAVEELKKLSKPCKDQQSYCSSRYYFC